MPDKNSLERLSKTGAIRIVAEPGAQHEPPPPATLPEVSNDGSTTGRFTIITEGKDRSAALDVDSGQQG